MPRSCTRTQTVSGAGAATETVTCTLFPEYFTALSRRLVTTVRSSSASPLTTSARSRGRVELDGARMKVMADDRQLDAFVGQRADVDRPAHDGLLALADDAGLEHLIDGVVQALGVGQHDVVELAASAFTDLARLQRLQVQANRRDGRLQLVRDGVDEAVVLLVALDLQDEEHGVDDQAGDDQGEQDDAEDDGRDPAGIGDDPADVEQQRRDDQQHAQGDEEGDGFLAPGHSVILAMQNSECRIQTHRLYAATGWKPAAPSPRGCRPCPVCILHSEFRITCIYATASSAGTTMSSVIGCLILASLMSQARPSSCSVRIPIQF